MNRAELQQLAEDRVLDAAALLHQGRWSGAYYIMGYAMECGLKSCVLAFVERTGEIFRDKGFSQRCFTHKLVDLEPIPVGGFEPIKQGVFPAYWDRLLIDVAGLKDIHTDLLKTNGTFAGFWGVAKDWSEAGRYQQRSETEAKDLYEAIINDPNGVLPWIQANW